MTRTLRFLRHLRRPDTSVVGAEEVLICVGGEEVEATLFLPRTRRLPVPGWVVLHGITVPGRRHAALTRFAASLAASGAAVLVPDVPAWRRLRISPAATETIEGGAHYLAERPEAEGARVGVVGFSMGATQALIAAADPAIGARVRTVVGFGGYYDLRRTVRCMVTGEHEWGGRSYTLDPDPYGRWIVAANYLTRVPGCGGMGRVAEALHNLAMEAGRRGISATLADYDPIKATVRETLTEDEQRVWDLLAPPAARPPADLGAARDLAGDLAGAALAAEPLLDPAPYLHLPSLRGRVVLGHGRDDRLIPFTETLRLHSHLPPGADASVTITGLLAHSTGAKGLRALAYTREGLKFFRLLGRALG